jgi:chromosome segregation ATPase
MDKLISHVEALAQHLASQAGTSSGETTIGHDEREAQSFLDKLDATCTEAKSDLKRCREGCAILEVQHEILTSELHRQTTQIEEYESMLRLAKKDKAELTRSRGLNIEHLETCDEALNILCSDIKHLDDRHTHVASLVNKADQRGELGAATIHAPMTPQSAQRWSW